VLLVDADGVAQGACGGERERPDGQGEGGGDGGDEARGKIKPLITAKYLEKKRVNPRWRGRGRRRRRRRGGRYD